MFNKLRNKLILINLSILTILLLAIFGSLYITTYTDVNNRIDNDLQRLLSPQNHGEPGEPVEPASPIQGEELQSVSFVLEITNNEITDSFSRVDFTQDFLEAMYNQVTDDANSFTLDEQAWQYESVEVEDVTLYAFVNTTNVQNLLSTTLTSYIVIFVISFILIALISYFMTNRTIRPVRESFDKQKRFVSDASHELKTPLTVINANVDVLLSQNTNSKDRKWLEYIQKEVLRMNKLTHNLLYLANVGNEESTFIQNTIDVSSEIESLLLGVEALMYEKEITLDYTIEPSLFLQYNQEQLNQIIMILLDNAIKYTPHKGSIEAKLMKSNNHILFRVKNTGTGIKEADIPHVFDRFYKVDESRQNTNESYGLGLSILKAICDRNNTKINISSEVNSYTVFELKFQQK